jgi:hypothetical protein
MKLHLKPLLFVLCIVLAGCSKQKLTNGADPNSPETPKLKTNTIVPAFYVSTTGSDSNAGTLAAPFLTLERARTAMRASGTIKTTYIRGGVYLRTAPLKLTTLDNGEKWLGYPLDNVNTADIDGQNTAACADVIDILGGSDIRIDNLKIRNFQSRGIGVHGGTAYAKAAPFFDTTCVAASNDTVSNNIVENGYATGNTWDRAGIHTEGNTPNTVITHNVVRNTTGAGIGVFSLQSGDNITGTKIINNAILNCLTGTATVDFGAIYTIDRAVTSSNITINNNFIRDYGSYNSDLRGIYLDDRTSYATVTGNIVSGTGTEAFISQRGNHNIISGNIIDLGSSGKLPVWFLINDGSIPATLPMVGNEFTKTLSFPAILLIAHTQVQLVPALM